MDDDSGYLTIILVLVAIVLVVFGVFLGNIIWADVIDTGSDLGMPVTQVDLSENGLALRFNLGDEQFEAVLSEAVSRPPNLGSASRLYVDNDRLMLTDSENQRLFELQVKYSSIRAVADS